MTDTRLTDPQLKILLAPVNPKRIGQVRGMSHMEAWDIRRQLIRIFGFGGYSTETIALDLVAERETKQGDRSRWTVVYRAQVRLTVYAADGSQLGCWDDGAAGDSVNQPSLGDAHDMAMKTALSQALKRCAVNLGDQFGLSLYNDGGTEAVVLRSLAHETPAAGGQQAMPEDPPVKPEPQPTTPEAVPAPVAPAQRQPEPPQPATPTPADDPADRDAALAEMWDAAKEVGFTDGLPDQFKGAFGHPIEQGTTAEYRQARDLMLPNAA